MATRIIVGSLIAAIALSGGWWFHKHQFEGSRATYDPAYCLRGRWDSRTGARISCSKWHPRTRSGTITFKTHPSWKDPLALFIAVAGIGVGAAVIVGRRRPLLR